VIQVKLFQPQAFLARPENRYLPPAYLELFHEGEEKHQVMCRGIETLAAFKFDLDQWLLRELHRAGVPLLLGTDSGTGGMGIVAGFSIHDELRILVENGFSPYEAIATGTVNASRAVQDMVGDGDFGVIEVGRRADLLLLYENPLEDVGAVQDLVGVMAAGRWYSREALDRMIAID
jgi:imidazolonepropionase-like amidohydrolase